MSYPNPEPQPDSEFGREPFYEPGDDWLREDIESMKNNLRGILFAVAILDGLILGILIERIFHV